MSSKNNLFKSKIKETKKLKEIKDILCDPILDRDKKIE